MDDAKEVEGDEVMLDLPEDVGERDDDGQGSAGPDPRAAKVPPRGGEDDASDDAQDEQSHGVLGHYTYADGGPDGEPPAGVVGGDEADDEPSDDRPPEQVERGVGQEASAEERLAADGCSKRGEKLCAATGAEASGGESCEQHDEPVDDCGEDTKTADGCAEEYQFEAADEDGEGRVFDVSPLEMLRVVDGLELVAVKAVLPICQKMEKKDGEAALDEKADVAAGLRVGGVARYAVGLAEGRLGGSSSTGATVHESMLHQERTRITCILRANVEV